MNYLGFAISFIGYLLILGRVFLLGKKEGSRKSDDRIVTELHQEANGDWNCEACGYKARYSNSYDKNDLSKYVRYCPFCGARIQDFITIKEENHEE